MDGGGAFVQPNGVLADGSGEPYATTGDPATDARWPRSSAPRRRQASPRAAAGQQEVLDALISILSGQ
jgi:hypothetical protein